MGGYDAIAVITDDFLSKLVAHDQMKRFFMGASENTRARRRQYIVDFICSRTGGPCAYLGRSMKEAHKGLDITESDWHVLSALCSESLFVYKLPQQEIDELLEFIDSLKAEIL
jgi:hemoglobin